MKEIIVVASTWVRGEKENQKCVAITLDQNSAQLLRSFIERAQDGYSEFADKLISGITEHTGESC